MGEEFTVKSAIQLAIFAVLAIFGTLARELRLSERGLVVARLISNIVVSTFGALICYFVFSMFDMPQQIGYITAGMVGFGGPQVIDNLFKKVSPDVAGYDNEKEKAEMRDQVPAKNRPRKRKTE